MASHSSVYRAAALYDLAFSYRDCGAEARFLREAYRRRRARNARSFLELAAGPAQHAVEMLGAGLDATALDLSPEMAAFGRSKAEARGLSLDYRVGDMTSFEAPRVFDLAACLLCSASYLLTNEDFLSHLRCVRAALAPDGMYVLELTHPHELSGPPRPNHAWKMRDPLGELEVIWGGDPAKAVDGVWRADVMFRYRPFDGGTAVTVHDQAEQRGYRFDELARLAAQSGFAIEVALGAFDEQVKLDDPKAHRMLLLLRRAE